LAAAATGVADARGVARAIDTIASPAAVTPAVSTTLGRRDGAPKN